jgi:hypothetical protein
VPSSADQSGRPPESHPAHAQLRCSRDKFIERSLTWNTVKPPTSADDSHQNQINCGLKSAKERNPSRGLRRQEHAEDFVGVGEQPLCLVRR